MDHHACCAGALPETAERDWESLETRINPQNWRRWKKVYHTCLPLLLGFLGPFGSSVYVPGHNQVMDEFHVSHVVSLLPFVLYLLGISLGAVVAGPLSENYGRKMVYLTTVPIFALFIMGAGLAQDIVSLTLTRLFAGVFSSTGLSIGTGTIADLWHPEQRGRWIALFIALVQLGSACGPLVGGIVTEKLSWRWTQWVTLFWFPIVAGLTIGMSETYKQVILQRLAKKQDPSYLSPIKASSTWEKVKSFIENNVIRPGHMLLTEPIAMVFDIYISLNFGLLNAFFAAFTWVFETVYLMPLGIAGLTYIGLVVGVLAGLGIILFVQTCTWGSKISQPQKPRDREPEHYLFLAKLGAPMIPISLFWFGWTARPSIHWISPILAEALFSCGNMLIYTCCSLYFSHCYGAKYGATAWSSNTFLRALFSVAFPLFTLQMYEGLGVGWATTLVGFASLVMVPIPFVLDRYGVQLRQKSRYASKGGEGA